VADRPRPPLRRPARGRVVAGVAAGVAAHLGLPVRAVRIGFVASAAVFGVGAFAYGLLWALVPDDAAVAGVPGGAAARRPPRSRFAVDGETGAWLLWGVALLTVGLTVLADRLGLGVSVRNVVPAALAVTGAVIVWSNLDATVRSRWVAGATGGTPRGGLRLAAGLVLVVVGTLLIALTGADAAVVRPAAVAALAVLAGVSLLLAPWALRLWRGFEAERAARARETERADIAAHLHDSVLQTLALIQRRSGDPAEVARLARAQERELRGWLYGPPPTTGGASLRAAVEEVLAHVEDDHAVPVEVVVVGDRPVDAGADALVLAVREATLNAVRHGRPPVRVYVEVAEDAVTAFVSDRGDGFDPDDVPADRLGVRESVVGRMERAGGTAQVRRASAGGTEVVLALPLGQGRPGPAPAQPPGAQSATRPREEHA
jgi:signal transduction histidine kinase/phage shock protein PspC (stress-responsive transcriptional regulator)